MHHLIALLLVCLAPAAMVDAPPDDDGEVSNGFELIEAMHARYEGKWYDKLFIKQKVIRPDQNAESESESGDESGGGGEIWVEYIDIPGKVHAAIGDPADGNFQITMNDEAYGVRDHTIVSQRHWVHLVLLLGFDVYLQKPEMTFEQLKESGFDLDTMHETTWQDRPVYVVGAVDGDLESNQFWIDAERLVFVRQITKTSRGDIIDIEMNKIKPLGEGWISTEIIFKRNDEVIITEEYLEYRILEEIDPALFDLSRLKRATDDDGGG